MVQRAFGILFIILCAVLWGGLSSSYAGVISTLVPFTDKDRVLVVAPHPDDEIIGAGGVIQQALKAGASVRVLLMTNGENNELSFIVYKKRPVLQPKELLAMGELRLNETMTAMTFLGLKPGDVVSLGYPDFGTMDVFTNYWGPVKRPFRSMLTRERKVPFTKARSYGADYVGENMLKDFTGVIREFRPTKVFVTHAADINRDHRAAYLFTKLALWQLEGEFESPMLYPYIVHVVSWPKPQGYHPELGLEVPPDLVNSAVTWYTAPLSKEELERKHQAVLKYVSQVKYAPSYLITFARGNELFGDYPAIPLVNQMSSAPVWQNVRSSTEDLPSKVKGKPDRISSLSYARQGSNLLVRVILKRAIDKEIGVSLFLIGYRKDVPFADMPKINLLIGLDGFHVKDRRKNISAKDVIFTSDGRELVFSLPLYLLGHPQRILSTAKTSLYDLALDETAWRVLLIQ
jgi:LmbE family N-acetylglucosaminyl deacetylase